ncbi:MAG TPA: proton-conducting transporter membrane subunit [Solirubrobacteraceae bacterium]|nr:proton-conducting transporter membrane subunit [Solirubrobacteraceae bacterium]
MHITALPVAVPLMAAALIVAVRRWLPRLMTDGLATGVGVGVVTLCALLLAHTAHGHPFAYWMGGWRPTHAVAIGISLSIDPIGAGLATFSALLVTASLVYSWRYFEAADGMFQALMLVFMGAMAGFSLTGDLFNLAVFFELMGATAYALTAHHNEEQGPIQGAINFAISNSIAAYAIFIGIALLYARTGALNMAQIGAALDHHAADPLVLVAMSLIFIGFLTKAAAVPVHFWLADAHAVAPAPVCVLFSGVMVELGIYAVARIYWTIFAGPLAPHADELRVILICMGTATALWGGVMCFAQRHVKRLLAFSTISHVGMFVCGFGLLSAKGVAAVAVYVIGHGFTKAGLFMLTGVLLHRFHSVDEFDLHGRGRATPFTGVLFAVGGLLLSAMPVVTLFFGKSLLDSAALDAGFPWLPSVFVISSMLTGGAVLRVAGRVFRGWGPAESAEARQAHQAREEEDEEDAPSDRTPLAMLVVPALLLIGAIVVGVIPGAVPGIEVAAGHFVDHASVIAWVLHGTVELPHEATSHVEGFDYLYGAGATVGALSLAALGLFGRPLRARLPKRLLGAVSAALWTLRRLHSGHIGDYIAWWTAGAALLGGATLVFVR